MITAELIQLAVSINGGAVRHANSLIRAGKFKESASWSGPSASAENALIESEGWAEYGKWFLGKQSDAEPDTKAHYRYPFSDDFEKVSINGLKAIRSRAAQNNETEIFNAAGRMLEAIEAKRETRSSMNTITLRQYISSDTARVNADAGEMYDVNILSIGEAKGHEMLITDHTLRSAMELLGGVNLPAYLSHSNAQGDRLLSEVGIFSGFYLDGEQIKARSFKVLESFRKYDSEQYERLFEMAATAPELFGVSIVFEGRLFWETEDGGEVEFSIMAERPEGAAYEMPSVEPTAISSADFVDNPAANPSLFAAQRVDTQTDSKEMKTETMETTEDHAELGAQTSTSEIRKGGEVAAEEAPKSAEKPKKKAAKKKDELAAEGEAMPLEITDEVQPELDSRADAPAANADGEVDTLEPDAIEEAVTAEPIDELRNKLAAAEARIAELEKLQQPGQAPLPVEEVAEDDEPKSERELLKSLINDHILQHPGDSRSTAVLRIAKTHPQLFQN